jgi:hypothetical protein
MELIYLLHFYLWTISDLTVGLYLFDTLCILLRNSGLL